MSLHVVVGAGVTGSATARLLAETGAQVRLVSRSGGGPVHERINRVTADATDAVRLGELAAGAATVFNCAMPPYDRWSAEFPPLAAAVLAAAERVGANYVLLGNDYGYGPADSPFTDDLPMRPSSTKGSVRAQMWQDALAAHEAGRIRVTEVRATDYVGRGAASPFMFLVAPVLSGTTGAYPGDLDVPHSWTYVGDVAQTLAAAARHNESWGRAWHVPSTSTASARELATRLATVAGLPAPDLRRITATDLTEMGRTNPVMLEFLEVLYLYEKPAVLDSSHTAAVLKVAATPIDNVLQELITEYAEPHH